MTILLIMSKNSSRCSFLLILKINIDSFAPAQLALRANLRLLYLAPATALDCLGKIIGTGPRLRKELFRQEASILRNGCFKGCLDKMPEIRG